MGGGVVIICDCVCAVCAGGEKDGLPPRAPYGAKACGKKAPRRELLAGVERSIKGGGALLSHPPFLRVCYRQTFACSARLRALKNSQRLTP
jgi:hypothetical protein